MNFPFVRFPRVQLYTEQFINNLVRGDKKSWSDLLNSIFMMATRQDRDKLWTYLPVITPIGSMIAYGGSTAPENYLLCDGTAISRDDYADLFGVIGITFGPGDGLTTFNLPDMRGKFPFGVAVAGTGSTLGGSFGSIDHTHTVAVTGENATVLANLAPVGADGSYTTSANNPPGLALNFIIKI